MKPKAPKPDPRIVPIGVQLKERREQLKLTQAQVAAAMSRRVGQVITHTQVSRWERGVHEPINIYRRAWELTLLAAEKRQEKGESA